MAQAQITANGTSDASGNVTIKFPSTAVGAEFTGVVSVPQAPLTSEWSVIINDTPVATSGGSSQYGPLQLNSSDVLKLVGSGLTASVQYQAVLIGALVQGTSGSVIPIPTVSAVTAASIPAVPQPLFMGAITTNTGIAGKLISNIPPTTRTLVLTTGVIGGLGVITKVQVIGQQSGVAYYNGVPYLVQVGSQSYLVVVPMLGVIDNSVLVNVVNTSPTVSLNAFADTAEYDESVFYNGAIQTAFLNSNGLLVSGPIRLLTAQMSAGAAGSQIEIGGVPALSVVSGQDSLSFGEGKIVPAGTNVSVAGGAATPFASITYAYP